MQIGGLAEGTPEGGKARLGLRSRRFHWGAHFGEQNGHSACDDMNIDYMSI
jgi:hypothetical protein